MNTNDPFLPLNEQDRFFLARSAMKQPIPKPDLIAVAALPGVRILMHPDWTQPQPVQPERPTLRSV